MKKLSPKARLMDVIRSLSHRQQPGIRTKLRVNRLVENIQSEWRLTNSWILDSIQEGLIEAEVLKKKRLVLHLPEVMDFSDNYEKTAIYINAIRKLVTNITGSKKALRLCSVRFQKLRKISTSAALVLTAELSKWDDRIKSKLVPQISTWNQDILQQFYELGFFKLFDNSPDLSKMEKKNKLNFVKYIKGKCGDKNKTRELKKSIIELIGESVSKWTFLHSGLSEAITNVSHHAYPDKKTAPDGKVWYLTGSFNSETNEIKIAFYDQGIGIPRSLPSSNVYEKVLEFINYFPATERRLHKTLLKAAVQIDRTSTGITDRGKGLQDLLEFIKKREQGYLSILSLKGLYKYTVDSGSEHIKSESFDNELPGTLIIWCVKLTDNQEVDDE